MHFFFWISLPVEGIITNLTLCQLDGGKKKKERKRVQCYFNLTEYSESECKISGFNTGVVRKREACSKESPQVILSLQGKSTFLDTACWMFTRPPLLWYLLNPQFLELYSFLNHFLLKIKYTLRPACNSLIYMFQWSLRLERPSQLFIRGKHT